MIEHTLVTVMHLVAILTEAQPEVHILIAVAEGAVEALGLVKRPPANEYGGRRDNLEAARNIHGRVIGGYLGAKELEHYQRLKQREREVVRAVDFDAEMLAELEGAEYGVVAK